MKWEPVVKRVFDTHIFNVRNFWRNLYEVFGNRAELMEFNACPILTSALTVCQVELREFSKKQHKLQELVYNIQNMSH